MALRGESGLNACLWAGKAVPLQKPGTHGTYVGVNPKGNDQPTKNTEGGKGGEYCILVGKAGNKIYKTNHYLLYPVIELIQILS